MHLIKNQIVIIVILCSMLAINLADVSNTVKTKRGIMDNFSNGLKYAGQMLGIKTASDVAELVSKAFIVQKKQDDDDNRPQMLTNEKLPTENVFNPTGIISGLLRLMGFDTRKLGALAINGIIMIAQLIGNTLIGRRRPQPVFEPNSRIQEADIEKSEPDEMNEIKHKERAARNGSPMDWILENTSDELQNLLKEMQNKRLPEYLTETVNKLEKEKGSGDCIKQLLCKSAPFIWSMQQSIQYRLNNNTDNENNAAENDKNRLDGFFKYLPDVETFKQHGYLCEEKYSLCDIFNLNTGNV